MVIMTLDDDNPDAQIGFHDPLGFAKTHDITPCRQCGELTAWQHIALAVPLCSHVCFNRYVAAHSILEWVDP